MPKYKVSGSISYAWTNVVEADDEDAAIQLAYERAEDGDGIECPNGSPDYDEMTCKLVKEKS